jgi:hypothetical protein
VSLYLDSRPNQQGRSTCDAFARKDLAARAAIYPARSLARVSMETDIGRIDEYLRGELRPATNGLALFLTGAHGFFEAARFEAPFERHELHVGPQSRGGGLGVVGVRGTRVALEEGRVDELVIAAWPDVLTGDPDDAAQLADTLVTTARRTAAQVTFIEDSARLRAIGGVGAFLRYRMSAGLC